MTQRCFIIAEAGVNHNGSIEMALELIDVAAHAGADAVKFQTFKAEQLARPGANKAEYQHQSGGQGEDQLAMLKRLELQDSTYPKLIERCNSLGIEFLSTPFDQDSATFLTALGMKKIKIPSGEITNLPFLQYLADLRLPIILSTGMATLGEVSEAVETIKSSWLKFDIRSEDYLTLLHCTSNYPAQPQDVNLRAMATMREMFSLSVGYSDHTLGTTVSVAAAALGAAVIEKHFTLDCTLEGPDHKASLTPSELVNMVSQIRMVELALGNGDKTPRESELPIRDVARRSVTLTRAVKAGEKITPQMLSLMRPGNGIAPKHLNDITGMKSVRDLAAWTTLTWDDVSS